MQNTKKYYLVLALLMSILALENCKKEPIPVAPVDKLPSGTTQIVASPQRTNGDVAAGYDYLINGNYLSSGIPLGIFKSVFGANSPDDLNRTGDAKGIAASYNVVSAANGVKIVAPNCLSCHSDKLNGQLIVGLGNTTTDNTNDASGQVNAVELLINLKHGANSPEMKAFQAFARGSRAVAPFIKTDVQGVSPADKIFAVLAAHRKTSDLTWIDKATSNIPTTVIPTDIPAWWLLKKKNALYYNALGVGDMSRTIMSAAMLTLIDSTEARSIEPNFVNVLAYIKNLKAPKYPKSTDAKLVADGQTIFVNNCAKCHGNYSTNTYPNLLVDLPTIGTDKALAEEYGNYPEYNNWFNKSWFGAGKYSSQLNPTKGYLAPPLDGIWATAPYLHNGSVPTLEDLLNSKQRPAMWSRTFDNSDYNDIKVGWNYTVETSKVDAKTYNTAAYGYSNTGHTYGDFLTVTERKALIEYLKTL